MDSDEADHPPTAPFQVAPAHGDAGARPSPVGIGRRPRATEWSISTMQSDSMKFLAVSAERGDAGAQFNLGVMFDSRLDDNNHATVGNRNEAIAWLRRAALQGLGRAQARLAQLYADRPLTPDDLVRSRAWYLRAVATSTGAHRSEAQTGLDRVTRHLDALQIARSDRLARFIKLRDAVEVASGASS